MNSQLFDDDGSENEVTFKSSSCYAKKYNTLRRKEELLKLKNKLGDEALASDDSSSSEDEEDDFELTEQFEKDFFKTLSYLKKKDPKIYDTNVRFFDNKPVDESNSEKKSKAKEKPMTIRDYNREAILETGGMFSDEEENTETGRASPTYVQEQKQIKETFHSVLKDDDDDEKGGGIGGMFVKKNKSKEEEEEEEKKYHEWIAGESSNLKDDEEKELRALKDYWSNPQLDEGEAFLRDYFVNQGFKEHTNKDYVPSYEEIIKDEEISEDERRVEEQTEFEHKFNFRFEEPDQEFIKRYPRTLEHSVRRKDNKRAEKRAEVRERKAEEKKKKKEEIAQLKSLKLKEIQEKIVKLKEITGNDQLAFKDEDIEGDFNSDEHDKRMRELFDEEYYGDVADATKPEFPDLDNELELENWDGWVENDKEQEKTKNKKATNLHCEDEDFNMDCEYDSPRKQKNQLLDEMKEGIEGRRKRRKRKNKLAEALAKKKPVFDPKKMDKSFAEYLDEYYKLDCEDVIGDMPCRFKYREVPACDYGLTTAEILMADDKELNHWYSLKKTLQYRQNYKQLNDQQVYSMKARNIELKKRIIPSLFKEQEEDEDSETTEKVVRKKNNRRKKNKGNKNVQTNENKDKNKDKPESNNDKKKKKHSNVNKEIDNDLNADEENNDVETNSSGMQKKKGRAERVEIHNKATVEESPSQKNKKKRKHSELSDLNDSLQNENDTSNKGDFTNSRSKKKKLKNKVGEDTNVAEENESVNNKTKKREKSQRDEDINEIIVSESTIINVEESKKNNKKKKKQKLNMMNGKTNTTNDPLKNISDERLKAYGLNPKKYRNFQKYKKF